MKTLAEWLARKPKGPALKRPLPRVTPKRAKQNREYSVRRKAFLLAHPTCMAWRKIVEEAPASSLWLGEGWRIPVSCPPSEEIHHTRKPKCKYLNDESTWLAVSMWAHRWIEDRKDTARRLGLLH